MHNHDYLPKSIFELTKNSKKTYFATRKQQFPLQTRESSTVCSNFAIKQ